MQAKEELYTTRAADCKYLRIHKCSIPGVRAKVDLHTFERGGFVHYKMEQNVVSRIRS